MLVKKYGRDNTAERLIYVKKMKIMKVDEIIIRPFPYTRKDKGFYAYTHYGKWTKQITAEGKTEEEAYNKAVKYCRKNNIEV